MQACLLITIGEGFGRALLSLSARPGFEFTVDLFHSDLSAGEGVLTLGNQLRGLWRVRKLEIFFEIGVGTFDSTAWAGVFQATAAMRVVTNSVIVLRVGM